MTRRAAPFDWPEGAIDESRALKTLQNTIRRPSVTGNEAAFAGDLAALLVEIGAASVTSRDFSPGRPNVWGVKRGRGGGRRLMLAGHTDVVDVPGWSERWRGDPREDPFGAAIVDGAVWGRGAADLKAGIAMTIEAVRTLERAGIELLGDIVFAFVGDEESGQPETGVSAGMKAFVPLIESGEAPRPDMAIYVEPTCLDIFTAQMGFFICDIEVTGRTSYFGLPERGVDALKATHAILSALWAHSAEMEKRGSHELVGKSFLLVTSIEGGGLIAVPGRCRLSLIRKLRPGEGLDQARQDLEAAVRRAGTDPEIVVSFSYSAGRDDPLGGMPSEVDPAHDAIALLQQAVRHRRPDRGRIAGAPFWSEASFLTGHGIPTVYFAPGDIGTAHTSEEHVPIEEYLSGIAALAEFIGRYCGTVARTDRRLKQQ
jgi:acetylornithine deacetylase